MLKILSKVYPKITYKVTSKARFDATLFASSNGIPNLDHLLILARGPLIHGGDVDQDPDADQDPDIEYRYYRKDTKNGYHIFITDNGEVMTDQWEVGPAEYEIHHDVLLIDEAPLVVADALEGPYLFDGAGNEVKRTWAQMVAYAAGKSTIFAGPKMFLLYDEALTGTDLTDAIKCVGV